MHFFYSTFSYFKPGCITTIHWTTESRMCSYKILYIMASFDWATRSHQFNRWMKPATFEKDSWCRLSHKSIKCLRSVDSSIHLTHIHVPWFENTDSYLSCILYVWRTVTHMAALHMTYNRADYPRDRGIWRERNFSKLKLKFATSACRLAILYIQLHSITADSVFINEWWAKSVYIMLLDVCNAVWHL